MKLLIDMFSCQTGSRQRGIGRYSLSLAEEMSRLRGRDDMAILANGLYPESFEELRQRFIRVLPSGSFLPYYHYALAKSPTQHFTTASKIAETFIEHAYQAVSADFILTPSLFEGWGGVEYGWVPLPSKDYPNQQRAVILYDLIPYVFRQHYLEPDPLLKAWYMERMEILRKFDLLLAISEATRQDAINFLGIEPDRVVNISGAASSHFGKLEFSIADRQDWLHRLGISRPFVLYIGGDDFRKNMEGAVRAYARLPRELISMHQLVLNDVGDEATFRSKVRLLGLADDDVVIFRRRSDKELEALYNLCKVFMFPSLYEGFGLPILEAMACGAPVIAANNSSLPEVVGREDALFDASRDHSVTDLLHKVLTDDGFRSELAEYGPRRAREFSWNRSARLAWEAFRQTHERKKQRVTAAAPAPERGRLRVAHVSPLPPQKSGVAMYCAGLLPYLAEHMDLDLFTEPGVQVTDPALTGKFKVFPWTELLDRRDDYDAVIYHMGNSELHLPMLDLLAQLPGVVVSHDFFMSNLPFVQEVRSGKRRLFRKTIDESHGLPGLLDYIDRGADKARWDWPMNWRVLRGAQELIVHSPHQQELIDKFYAHGWKPRPTLIKTYRESVPESSASARLALRRKLDLPEEALLFCSFGFMAETKLNHEVIRAFAQARPNLGREARLIFVGEAEGGEYGRTTQRLLKDLKLEDAVEISGYVSPAKYQEFLAVADVAIQLRAGSRGETSSAILDCLVHGLPTITNAHGSFRDFPEDVLVRLPEMPSPRALADAMQRLGADEIVRAGLGRHAREYAVRAHDPRSAAEQYAEVIRRAAQTSEKGIFRLLLEALAELKAPEDIVQASSRLAAAHLTLRSQPRLLIDVSALDADGLNEADRQEATDLIRQLSVAADPSVHLELIHAPGGRLVRASRLIETILRRPRFTVGTEEPVYVRPGDVLLMIDVLLPWASPPAGLIGELRLVGGRVVTIATARPDRLVSALAAESDLIICGSLNAAEQVYAMMWRPAGQQVVRQDVVYLDSADARPRFRLFDAGKRVHESAVAAEATDAASDGAWAHRLVQGAGILGGLDELTMDANVGAGAAETDDALPAPLLRSVACSQEALESSVFQEWVGRFGGRRGWMHRKPWEWAYICQALFERGLLAPGSRGLVFAVGTEPLPALFASYGCEIVATDLRTEDAVGKSWLETNQHSASLADLYKPEILPEADFNRLVSFRFVDMTRIGPDLRDFDFVWSSCSLEHLGTLEKGRQFIFESLKCLRPGGVAVHTTEYNISSNTETKEEGPDVIYRRRDIEEIASVLRAQGHSIDPDFTLGKKPLDLQVDKAPFKLDVHLRLEIWGYVCTSFGMIIQKGWARPGDEPVLPQEAVYSSSLEPARAIEVSTAVRLDTQGHSPINDSAGLAGAASAAPLVYREGIVSTVSDGVRSRDTAPAPVVLRAGHQTVSAVRCEVALPETPKFSIMIDEAATDSISLDLKSSRYVPPAHYKLLMDLAGEGDTILDLGAHVGTFSLYAAAKALSVVSVEASPRNAALLAESARQNAFHKMRVIWAAATDKPGVVHFVEAGPYGLVAADSGDARGLTVPALRVDEVVASLDLHRVTLVKMDIEGSEVAAVQGMQRLLSDGSAPAILFESNAHTLRLSGRAPRDLFLALETAGYACYLLHHETLYPINPNMVQLKLVADCLAVKHLPARLLDNWSAPKAISSDQTIDIVLSQVASQSPEVRCHIAGALRELDSPILSDPRITAAMQALKSDPDPMVTAAAGWWPGTHGA